MNHKIWDLIIVGAGPAGTCAALSAKVTNPDSQVLLIDKAPPGRDKVCGDGIGPEVLDILISLNAQSVVRPQEAIYAYSLAVTNKVKISGQLKTPGYVIPRAIFDKRLLDLAIGHGVEFIQAPAVGVEQDANKATVFVKAEKNSKVSYFSKVVIAADGAYSPIRRSLGLPPNKGRDLSVAIRGYIPKPENYSENLLISWDDKGSGLTYAWVFPTADGRLNVGYGTTLRSGPVSLQHLRQRLDATLGKQLPLMGISLQGHQLPLSTYRPCPAHGRVLLVGDAASLINPLSGEGILYAMISGSLAGNCTTQSKQPGLEYSQALSAALGKHHKQVTLMSKLANPRTVALGLKIAQKDKQTLGLLHSVALGTGSIRTLDYIKFFSLFIFDPLRNKFLFRG